MRNTSRIIMGLSYFTSAAFIGFLLILMSGCKRPEPHLPSPKSSGSSANGAQGEFAGKDPLSQVSILDRLSGTEFLLPDRELVVGYKGILGLPQSAFERIYLKTLEGFKQINGPEDLVGHVQIASPEAALRYARLFTSPATSHTLPEPSWFEVVPASAVDPQFVFGRGKLLPPRTSEEIVSLDMEVLEAVTGEKNPERLRKIYAESRKDRFLGILTDGEWRESGLPAPEAELTAEGFVVTRCLFYASYTETSTEEATLVAETISAYGHLQRKTLGKNHLRKICLVRPLEE